MILTKDEYKRVEYCNEYEEVIGSITYKDEKMCEAEICTTWITSNDEIKDVEEFLDALKRKDWYNHKDKD